MARTPPTLVWIYLTASAAAQDPIAHLLPTDARVIETANVHVRIAASRALVLWMKAPRRVTARWDSAADVVYGEHWFGPTFLSLVDPSSAKLINTVRIRPDKESSDNQGLAVPFFTYDGPYYVPHPDKERRGKPLLLNLHDLTGEGVAGQFVLFEHVVSGIASGSVLGYSAKSDTAAQYSIESIHNRFNAVVKTWAIQVFSTKPSPPGYWKFTWEAGHGEMDWIDEEVRFDAARQLFIERSATRPYPGYAQAHCDLNSTSLTNFLGHLQKVTQDEREIRWLEGLIGKATPNDIASAGMVPTFNGSQKVLDLAFQVSNSGEIGIDFRTDSDFASALQSELKMWCSAN